MHTQKIRSTACTLHPYTRTKYTFVLSLSKFLDNWVGCYRDVSFSLEQHQLCGNFIETQCSSLFGISSSVCCFFSRLLLSNKVVKYNNLLLHAIFLSYEMRTESKWNAQQINVYAVVLFATCHECMSMHFVFYAWSMQWYDFILMMLVSVNLCFGVENWTAKKIIFICFIWQRKSRRRRYSGC